MNGDGPYTKDEEDLIDQTLAATAAAQPLDNADDGRVDQMATKARAAVAARRQLLAKGARP